ncbi:MAG: riboflavin synthase subunit alpha [Chloroflexi bacterium RBG_16_50_9]|nr:MAG: riboflavin synthase subunit alpha [Chloroflexi bacterium RBG_16_50_9]
MFTGIVEEVGSVASVPAGSLVIGASAILKGIQTGGSIAVNGVCLTVTDFNDKSFAVDIMPETLRLTNLGLLRAGEGVNLERPLALGGELGGHLVQGHVDDTGRVASIIKEGEAVLMRLDAAADLMRFVVQKGFIAVDGVSLTVTGRDADSFQVSIVDYTRQHTILGSRKAGDVVNLEVDIIAKYVAQLSQVQHTGITAEFLRENGFPVN